MRSAFALSWNVQWLGSFPVSGTDPDTVSLRLDRFVPKVSPISVQLSVSVIGVKVSTVNDKRPLLCHSLRRVSCVVGRTERCQVAYIAREPTGQTYRRLCHLFHTDASHQVEEIESVLGNAFQAAAMARSVVPSTQLPPKPGQRIIVPPATNRASLIDPVTKPPIQPIAPIEMTPKQRPLCSSALLNRLFGSKSRAESEIFNKENAGANVAKRRRRPVSAVFSQAFQRLSSTTSIYNKRFSSVEPVPKERPISIIRPIPVEETPKQPLSSPPKTPARIPNYEETTPVRSSRLIEPSTPSLHFDERLSEWVYPIDESLEQQLGQVAYFCKNAPRSKVLSALLAQPEGSFVLRFSESKRKCLALSVRVPFTHNPTGVSHYLIVRNERGFKINGFGKYFPSIPMLVTHHSVMPELLPCRLVFAHWDNTWKSEGNTYDYPPCEDYQCNDTINEC